MIEHDALVGRLLDTVDKLGFAENTIVIYTTDNGPMVCLYPDSATTPFRGEKIRTGTVDGACPLLSVGRV